MHWVLYYVLIMYRLSWSIWTWCRWLCRFFERFLSQGSSLWRWWNRGRWIRRLHRECGCRFWFQGAWLTSWALTLVFLRLIVRSKFSNTLANLLMSLCIAISECVSHAASSSKRMSRTRTVLTLVLARRRATLREFIVGTGMKVHTISRRVKGIGQEGREEDSKECRG